MTLPGLSEINLNQSLSWKVWDLPFMYMQIPERAGKRESTACDWQKPIRPQVHRKHAYWWGVVIKAANARGFAVYARRQDLQLLLPIHISCFSQHPWCAGGEKERTSKALKVLKLPNLTPNLNTQQRRKLHKITGGHTMTG